MRKTISKKRAVVAGALALVVTGGGMAYAYWSSTGTGTGSVATAEDGTNLVIAQTPVDSQLAPGGPTATIDGTIANQGAHDSYVNAVTVSIDHVSTVSPGTCDASDYLLTGGTMPVAHEVAKGATAAFSGAQISFNDKATNQDGCKGATVHLAFTSD